MQQVSLLTHVSMMQQQAEAQVEMGAAPMPFYIETPTTPRRMQGRVSIEDVCEDPERLRSSFKFENSRASLSLHVAQGWIVPPTIGMEEEMNRTAELVAFLVQADMVHFDAGEEILEVQDKIAALEAQSANVHDESNAHKGRHKGCRERSGRIEWLSSWHQACSL